MSDVTITQRIKFKVIHKLYNTLPAYWCWADLVSWALSKRGIIGLFKEFDRKKGGYGCKSESKNCNSCYCGCWYNGKNSRQKDFVPPVYEELEISTPPF